MDIKVYIAQAIENLNKQRMMLSAALSLQPEGLTRHQLMDWPVVYEFERMTIIVYLNKLGKTIPEMRDMDTGKLFDHTANMIHNYLTKGKTGLNQYLEECVKIMGNMLNELLYADGKTT